MRTFALALVLLVIGGCDKEIRRYNLGSETKEEVISCSYSCTTYSCGVDYKGHLDCGLRHGSCGGQQHALVTRTQWKATYESEKTRYWESVEVQQRLTECR